MVLTIIMLFTGAVAAFWISAICGGGASLILIPVLNIMLPVPVVPFSLTIGTFASSVSRIFVFRKHIYWPVIFWFVPLSLPAVWLGASMLRYVNSVYIQLFIGFFLLLNVVQLFKNKGDSGSGIPQRAGLHYAAIGFFAGLISGLTGAVGLLFNRFYLKIGLSKEQIIATRAANEVFLHLIKLVLYIAMGIYSGKALFLGGTIAAASVVSALTVKYILPLLSEQVFRKIAYGSMALSGAFLLSATASQIITANNLSFISKSHEREYEAGIAWNSKHFIIEYAESGALEFEHTVAYKELPNNIKKHYDKLALVYNDIRMEKVSWPGMPDEFELQGSKGSRVFKFELK